VPTPTTFPYAYNTEPPYLRGPISKSNKLQVLCPNPTCGTIFIMWSPTISGVLVCPICNTRMKP
jgi:hypothetical protein